MGTRRHRTRHPSAPWKRTQTKVRYMRALETVLSPGGVSRLAGTTKEVERKFHCHAMRKESYRGPQASHTLLQCRRVRCRVVAGPAPHIPTSAAREGGENKIEYDLQTEAYFLRITRGATTVSIFM